MMKWQWTHFTPEGPARTKAGGGPFAFCAWAQNLCRSHFIFVSFSHFIFGSFLNLCTSYFILIKNLSTSYFILRITFQLLSFWTLSSQGESWMMAIKFGVWRGWTFDGSLATFRPHHTTTLPHYHTTTSAS